MKKILSTLAAGIAVVALVVVTTAARPDDVMTEDNGTYIINTTSLASDFDGYEGPTPLKIYIRKNKIEKVEALRNHETPKYWAKVKKQMLDAWNGMTVKKALKAEVDGVTGATFSADAVKENIRRGLNYYITNKKK